MTPTIPRRSASLNTRSTNFSALVLCRIRHIRLQIDSLQLLPESLAPIRHPSRSLVYFVRSMAGMDRAAAQSAFSQFLQDRSLSPQQVRFIEMIFDQLTARGVMSPAALYEAPSCSLHSGDPDALYAGRDAVATSSFQARKSAQELEQTG